MIPATNMLLTLCIVNGTTNSKQVKKKKKRRCGGGGCYKPSETECISLVAVLTSQHDLSSGSQQFPAKFSN